MFSPSPLRATEDKDLTAKWQTNSDSDSEGSLADGEGEEAALEIDLQMKVLEETDTHELGDSPATPTSPASRMVSGLVSGAKSVFSAMVSPLRHFGGSPSRVIKPASLGPSSLDKQTSKRPRDNSPGPATVLTFPTSPPENSLSPRAKRQKTDAFQDVKKEDHLMHQLIALLFVHRIELKSLFRFFDVGCSLVVFHCCLMVFS